MSFEKGPGAILNEATVHATLARGTISSSTNAMYSRETRTVTSELPGTSQEPALNQRWKVLYHILLTVRLTKVPPNLLVFSRKLPLKFFLQTSYRTLSPQPPPKPSVRTVDFFRQSFVLELEPSVLQKIHRNPLPPRNPDDTSWNLRRCVLEPTRNYPAGPCTEPPGT